MGGMKNTTRQELIEIYQRCGYRWEWAPWLIDLGDVVLNWDRPGDHEQAAKACLQSLEMFTEMSASGFIRVL